MMPRFKSSYIPTYDFPPRASRKDGDAAPTSQTETASTPEATARDIDLPKPLNIKRRPAR